MIMFKRFTAVLFCSIFFTISFIFCRQTRKPQLAFYHWKVDSRDNYISGVQERKAIQFFNTRQLFVKIMDIDWDELFGVYPVTTYSVENLYNKIGDKTLDTIVITPVIFITTMALEKTDSINIKDLAQKIILKTEQLVKGRTIYTEHGKKLVNDSTITYEEIQLDCDWTNSIQKKYFSLITEIKRLWPQKLITATLRLHQYKYPEKTGVPPADELYLMCYNTGEVKKLTEKNSIFDYEKAKRYFENTLPYPKKLNFALPAFDWVIIFKSGQFYKIDNNINENLFSDTNAVKYFKDHAYVMQKDTVINNIFLRRNDLLKWEKISHEALQQAAQLCKKAINSESFKVVFYDIDHINPDNYESIQKSFDYFNF